jgi:formate dehydrogenase subunit beta
MTDFYTIDTSQGLNAALAEVLGGLLKLSGIDAVLAPTRLPYKKGSRVVMQTLIADPKRLADLDPFAPVVTSNGAKLLSSVTYKHSGRKVAAVLRSCEVRAFVELVKLKQGRTEDLLLIGMDCHGRYENRDYPGVMQGNGNAAELFLKDVAAGKGTKKGAVDITLACQMCEYLEPGVDLRLCVFGEDVGRSLSIEAVTERGREALAPLKLTPAEPKGRQAALESLLKARIAKRDAVLDETSATIKKPAGMLELVGNCVNCYNCRVACPVCYCRECVFVTETFRHDSESYFRWAEKHGAVKLPTDTMFYHLTRMLHMSTLCVGCGQCTSACPNDIPVGALFRTVARRTQERFAYQPGRDLNEPQPLATFHSDELPEVTGQEAVAV